MMTSASLVRMCLWLSPALLFVASDSRPANTEDPAKEAGTPVQVHWRMPYGNADSSSLTTPVVGDGRLFTEPAGLQVYFVSHGKLLWQGFSPRYSARSLVFGNNTVFVAEEKVTALNGNTGRKLWEFKPDANTSLGRATFAGDALYFGTSSHRLYALQAVDGRPLWNVDLGPDWKYPAVVRGVTENEGRVYAAVEQWRTENGKLASGWLIALEAKTGKVLWRFSTGEDDQRRGLSSAPVVTSRLVLVCDYLSNAIVAVDRTTGAPVWRHEGERGFAGFPEAPIVHQDIVYAASGDTYVYALDLATGRTVCAPKHLLPTNRMRCAETAFWWPKKNLLVLDRQTGRIRQVLFTG